MSLPFKDQKKNRYLKKFGYVVIDFITQNDINLILDFYKKNSFHEVNKFTTTHFSNNTTYKKKVNDFIINSVLSNINNHFTDYRPCFANFMVKMPGEESNMPLHADWTYVEEQDASSYSIWFPLSNTSKENGGLAIIPFSNFISENIRGPRIFQWSGETDKKLINAFGKLILVKAGQAIIYNHKTLHFSPPNLSKSIRIAVNISLVPKNFPIIHYCKPKGQIDIYKYLVDDDYFFIDYENFGMPNKGILLEKIKSDVPLLDIKADKFIKEYKWKNFIHRYFNY